MAQGHQETLHIIDRAEIRGKAMRSQKSHILLQVTEELSIPEPYMIDNPRPLPKSMPELSLPSLAPVEHARKEVEGTEQGQGSVVIVIDL